MNKKIRIALDGPSGAGKSTIAKKIAHDLDIDYIDTGAMYRAIGYKLKVLNNVNLEDAAELQAVLDSTEIDFHKGNTLLDGNVINDEIRTPEATKMASLCSAIPAVREKLVVLQRKMGQEKSVVMDGRDIGTNVLKDAEYKFFMTASAEERAERRYKEMLEKGMETTYDEVLNDIIQRDHNDTTRELNPLRKAEDALEVDTTGMSIEEVVEFIVSRIK